MAAVTCKVALVGAVDNFRPRSPGQGAACDRKGTKCAWFPSSNGVCLALTSRRSRTLDLKRAHTGVFVRGSNEEAAGPASGGSNHAALGEAPAKVPAPEVNPSSFPSPTIGVAPGTSQSPAGRVGLTPGSIPSPVGDPIGDMSQRPANSEAVGQTPVEPGAPGVEGTEEASHGGGQAPGVAAAMPSRGAGGRAEDEAARATGRPGGAWGPGEGAKERARGYVRQAHGVVAERLEKLTDSAEGATERLWDRSERAREELRARASEARGRLEQLSGGMSARGREELQRAAGRAPPGVLAEVAETAQEAHMGEGARPGAGIRDFCLGIPYGALLTLGGLLWCLISGSIDALRYNFVGGLVILIASVRSLRAWRQGKETGQAFKIAQAVAALFVSFKEARYLSQSGGAVTSVLTTVASFWMVAFYGYILKAGWNKQTKVEEGVQGSPGLS